MSVAKLKPTVLVSKHSQYRGILASIQKKYADRFDPKMTKKCEGKKFLEK